MPCAPAPVVYRRRMPDLSSPAPPSGVEGFWAVIPAGGAGTRLWPLSRASSPKFLHDLTGTRPVAAAVHLGPADAADRRQRHGRHRCPARRGGARAAAGTGRGQPARRAVAAGLDGRDRAGRRGPGAARPGRRDRLVRRRPRHRRRRGVPGLRARGRRGGPAGLRRHDRDRADPPRDRRSATSTSGTRCRSRVPRGRSRSSEFVEKPDAATAGAWLATGEYRWNAGMFVVRAVGAARPPRDVPARAGERPAAAGGRAGPAGRAVAGADQDRDRPRRRGAGGRRRPGRRRARRLRLGRRGRLLLARVAGRRHRGRAGAEDPRRRATTSSSTTPGAWSCRGPGARWPCSAWTTSSWWTPRTRCW